MGCLGAVSGLKPRACLEAVIDRVWNMSFWGAQPWEELLEVTGDTWNRLLDP